MRITLSVIKADIGSVGGHLLPSESVIDTVRQAVHERKKELLLDYSIGSTGDAIAVLMTHRHGAASSSGRARPMITQHRSPPRGGATMIP